MANVPLNLVHDDLRKIAKEISVQVLTHQPENIYKFTADYLNNKLGKRERKDAEIFIRDLIEHDFTYEAMIQRWGVSLEAAHKASSVMQVAVRRFLKKQKVKREHEKIDISMDSTVVKPSVDSERTSKAVILQQESPPGDAKPLEPLRALSSSNSRRLFMNLSILEGDVIRAGGTATLAAAQNMGSFDEHEEIPAPEDAKLPLEIDPSQELNENTTKNFAESMLIDIISGIFENDVFSYGKSFDQELERLSQLDDHDIVTRN